jgi:phospholipase D1/2
MPAVEAAGLLIDGRNYYRAFYCAARKAQRHLLIAGWRFNSDVRLLRGKDAREAGEEIKFLAFLNRLCEENPELHIYVLAWDFSVIFLHEWELFQTWKFQRGRHGRLRFLFDDNHAVGASHHQKFVVVDGQLAFLGGLDFNADDWDDRHHYGDNPDRADSGHEQHKPYHDIQTYLVGADAARDLASCFCERWRAAGGEEITLPQAPPLALPPVPVMSVRAGRLALSRNQPRTFTNPDAIYEIRRQYLDAIDAAQELIFIENQYFSSELVYQALLDRMRAPGRSNLNIVLVLPKRMPSWVESVALAPPRIWMLAGLRETARETGHHLGVYYPAGQRQTHPEKPVVVHSKLLIVDDRFMTVGSANTSNRSMGLDTELNVSWEATSADAPLIRSIRRVRVSLLAEHAGCQARAAVRAQLRQKHGLVSFLDRCASEQGCRLRPLTEDVILGDREWMGQLAKWGVSLDPDGPIVEDTLFEPLEASANLVNRGITWFRDWLKTLAGEANPNGNSSEGKKPAPQPESVRAD